MKTQHWVIVADWCIDYQNGHEVIGVYHNELEAKKAFKDRVNSSDRVDADSNNYIIYEDTEFCFDSGQEGNYVVNHITVKLEAIQVETINRNSIVRAMECLFDNGVDSDECPIVLEALCAILLDANIEELLKEDDYEGNWRK